jgi:hypothetical protein
MNSKRDVWKDRAWRASSAMHTAVHCRSVDDMRKTILEAWMELSNYFVQDQNARSLEVLLRTPDMDDDQIELELAALAAADKSGK